MAIHVTLQHIFSFPSSVVHGRSTQLAVNNHINVAMLEVGLYLKYAVVGQETGHRMESSVACGHK